MVESSHNDIARVCERVKNLLLEKNLKYGDSALNPIRIMSQSGPIEQILVRIDDKLNRVKQGGILTDDEDVLLDLIGYFVLLKIALERDAQGAYNDPISMDS
jgi:hypothetical protein